MISELGLYDQIESEALRAEDAFFLEEEPDSAYYDEAEEFFPILPLVAKAAPLAISGLSKLLGRKKRRQRDAELAMALEDDLLEDQDFAPGFDSDLDTEFEQSYEFEDFGEGLYEDTEEFAPWDWLTKKDSIQRKVALGAAKGVASALPTYLGAVGGVGGALAGSAVAPGAGTAVGGTAGAGLGQAWGTVLGKTVEGALPDEMMAHLGELGAAAQDEGEAEALIGGLVPAIAGAAPAIKKAAPHLIKGVTRAARLLRQHPGTRKLVRALPAVVKKTAKDIQKRAALGIPTPPVAAQKVLAKNTYRTLRSPQRCAHALRLNRALSRRFQRRPS